MASIISAGTTTGTAIAISGDTTGNLAFQTQAGANTITVPNNTGTLITTASTFAGTGPAFSAYRSGTQQSISNATWTKVQFQTEEFDTASCYDNATNFRFTPNVAGYYQVNACVYFNNNGYQSLRIYKNGSAFKSGSFNINGFANVVSALIYMNGTTDYVEIYGWDNNGYSIEFGQLYTYFQASMVRSA